MTRLPCALGKLPRVFPEESFELAMSAMELCGSLAPGSPELPVQAGVQTPQELSLRCSVSSPTFQASKVLESIDLVFYC